MKQANLKTNQLSPQATTWYFEYLAAIDAKDLDTYGTFLDSGCSMLMNNGPAVEGKELVLAGLCEYWPSFASLEHDLLNIYGTDSSFCLAALNRYTRHDGKLVTLRAVAFTDRKNDGLAISIRVYTDTGPLFDEARE